MPTYDYACSKCRHRFTLSMSVKQYETKRVQCPKCKSRQVEQQWRPFYVVTSKKS